MTSKHHYVVHRDNLKNNFRIKFKENWVSYLDHTQMTRITRTWKTEADARTWITNTLAYKNAIETRFEVMDLPNDATS
jgi:hypothetical protein